MKKYSTKYIWYIIDTIIFAIINILIWRSVKTNIDLTELISPFKLFVFGLGVYRLSDIITSESVTDFLRAPFMDKKIVNGEEKTEYASGGFREFFGILFSCSACIGVWIAMITFYLYIFFPVIGSSILIIMALSALERLFSKIYNFFDYREKR